jgi:membrane protein
MSEEPGRRRSLEDALWRRVDSATASWTPEQSRRISSLAEGIGLGARVAISTRLTGLAAEMAFWGIFALPWVLLGAVAGFAWVQDQLGLDVLQQLETLILDTASRVLTAEVVQDFVEPLVAELFEYGSTGLSLLSFLIALWAGSRLVATAVQGIVIVSGERYAGYARTRARSLLIYGVGLVLLVPVTIVVLVGPALFASLFGGAGAVITWILSLTVIALGVVALYQSAITPRRTVRQTVPGALLAVTGWVLGSLGLRVYLQTSFERGSLYGIVGAPIAIMLWGYLTSYVVLLGALLNRVIEEWREVPGHPVLSERLRRLLRPGHPHDVAAADGAGAHDAGVDPAQP